MYVSDSWVFFSPLSQALPNQQVVDYPSFKLVIVGDGGTGEFLLPFFFAFYEFSITRSGLSGDMASDARAWSLRDLTGRVTIRWWQALGAASRDLFCSAGDVCEWVVR